MKRLIGIAAFTALSLIGNSQDLIVTSKNDSLNCKIVKYALDSLYFRFTNSDGVEFNSYMARNQIKEYIPNYYKPSVRNTVDLNDISNFWFSVSGGLGHGLGEIDSGLSPAMQDYLEKLRNGPNLGMDAILFFGYTSGIGLKYSRFYSSNSLLNSNITTVDGVSFYGDMRDHITINFYGLAYATRFLNINAKQAFTGNIGLGIVSFKNDGFLISDLLITGQTVGLSLDIGYVLKVSDYVGLGFQTSLIRGVLTKYKYEYQSQIKTVELDRNNYLSASHLDFSVRLTFLL